ncbi:MAG TPA: ABC transporter ATP-binding protein [bacterium]|nr:ABC transporter ATP-binding protein [bacterium]
MASVAVENVTVSFPVYGSQKMFRKELAARVGGLIRREGRHNRVTIRALENVSLRIDHGDRVGILGYNGAGKSTLLRVLAGVYQPVAGRVAIEGRVSPLFNIAPGLDMDDTGYENIITCGLFLGMHRDEIRVKIDDIAAFSELGDYLSLPVRTYSSGMLSRLCFAVATAIDPEILLLDEGIGAGDARFAERAAKRVDALLARANILVLASHSDAIIQSMCTKALLLDSGRVVMLGDLHEVSEVYRKMRETPPEQPQPSLAEAVAGGP